MPKSYSQQQKSMIHCRAQRGKGALDTQPELCGEACELSAPLPHLLHCATQARCVPASARWRCHALLGWQGRNWLPVQSVFSSRLFTAHDLVFSNCTSITHIVHGTTSTNLPLPFFSSAFPFTSYSCEPFHPPHLVRVTFCKPRPC